MTQAEKDRWAAEVRFLKVYYHYWLIRMYGPIPIMDRNIPVNASEDEVKVLRLKSWDELLKELQWQ